MIDHLSYTHNLRSCEIRPGRDWTGLDGTHDLCETDAVQY